MNMLVSIILFYPTEENLLKIIKLSEIVKILIVDNSDNDIFYINNNSNIDYVKLYKNHGIAHALNIACKKAIEQGYDWCVTLDQDSEISETYLNALHSFNQNEINVKIGVLAPQYISNEKLIINTSEKFSIKNEVITSGSCINLNAYKEIGGFRNDFFIDAVDFAYCWDLRKKGYKIIQMNYVFINHHLGEYNYEYKIKNKHIASITNHSALRKYYIVRNNLTLRREYKQIFPKECKLIKKKLFHLLLKVVIFENNKLKKIKAMFLGFKDYKHNRMGKITEEVEKRIN
ncbi:MAG: glycosyltransferase [Treponema sp.]|nr:glycosyltransferase [Spirochaetia bacterium]MDY2838866.1 glycosyltransferase [Treponema sp.]